MFQVVSMLKRLATLFMLVSIIVSSLVGCSTSEQYNIDVPIEFSLSQYSEMQLEVEVDKYDSVTFYLLPFEATEDNLEIVNSNIDVAECTFYTNAVAGKKIVVINIKGISEGNTTVYLKDRNSTSVSDNVNITVFKKEEEIDNSRIVYTNLNGDKYHYSKSCAGKSAYETTLKKVERYKEPCSKCVH